MNFKFWKKQEQPESRGLDYISFALPCPKMDLQVSPLALSALFRGVMLISDTLSVLPFNVKRVKKGNSELIYNHPVNLIFRDKTDMTLTFSQFIKMIIQECLLKGNSFAYVYRAADGTPIKLRFLRAGDVVIDYNEVKDTLYYKCSKVAKGRIEPVNMLHFKKYSQDGINGISIIKMAWRTLQISTAAENNALSTFSSGGTKIGYLKSSVPISAEQKQQVLSDWNNAYANNTDYSRIAVLGNNLEYNSIASTGEETQLLSTREFSVQEIARFLGISPVLLGDLSHSSYSTIEASLLQFLSQTIQPYIKMIEDEMTKKLFKPSEMNLKVDIDDYALLLSDKNTLANYYSTLVSNGIMTLNEARQNLDLPEKEGADELIIPYTDLGMNTLGTDNQSVTEEQEQPTDNQQDN